MCNRRSGSADTNKGFGGIYTWIVPVRTDEREEAADHFDLKIAWSLPKEIGRDKVLEITAGGNYRYLIPVRGSRAIKNLCLFRPFSFEFFNSRSHCTGDINYGRGGDYLYLCWEHY